MSEKKHENQVFDIGSFRYELRFKSPGSVSLYSIGGYSKSVGNIRDAYREHDPFQKWEDYDPDEFGLIDDQDFDVPVFQLARECVNRIAGWANREKPGFFLLSPSTDRKEKVYDRIAKIIDRKVKGYQHYKIRKSHYFYRVS